MNVGTNTVCTYMYCINVYAYQSNKIQIQIVTADLFSNIENVQLYSASSGRNSSSAACLVLSFESYRFFTDFDTKGTKFLMFLPGINQGDPNIEGPAECQMFSTELHQAHWQRKDTCYS